MVLIKIKEGLRIDLVLSSENLMSKIKDTGIDIDARGMENPQITVSLVEFEI